jgi:hypothetical protein
MKYPSRPAAKPVAELIGATLDPIARKRGLARAELLSWWPDIVGAEYAGRTAPERIRWPRGGGAATLVVRCDPALSLQLAHETDRVRERLNAYFGYPAVGAVRIVRQTIGTEKAAPPKTKALGAISAATQSRLEAVEAPLRDSLRALAKSVLARS